MERETDIPTNFHSERPEAGPGWRTVRYHYAWFGSEEVEISRALRDELERRADGV